MIIPKTTPPLMKMAMTTLSCFQTFTLTNNARLRHLLISENPEEGKDTAFGRAFHAQLLVASIFIPHTTSGFPGGVKIQVLYKASQDYVQRLVDMSRPSTRQSRRLHGQPASPPQPLPQRRSRPHTRILQEDINAPVLHTGSNAAVDVAQTDLAAIQDSEEHNGTSSGEDIALSLSPNTQATFRQLIDESDLHLIEDSMSASPFYPLAPIYEPSSNFSPVNHAGHHHHSMVSSSSSPNIHSPRARYPVSCTASFGSSSLGFPLGLESPASPVLETFEQTHSSLGEQFPPVNTENRLIALPSRIGNGSLANLRERERQRRTPALPLFLPSPDTPPHATQLDAAIYLGLPMGDSAQCGFLELVTIATIAPLLSDLLGALSGRGSTAAAVLNRICGELDQIEYRVACSQRLVEVHDASYSMLQNGCFEQGSLRTHILASTHPIASATRTTPAPRAWENSRPASRSMSRTPNSLPILPLQRSLTNLAVVCVALDTHFLQEGHQLAALMEDSDSRPRFGVAYMQIRQVIILESILSRSGNLIPTPAADFPPSESVPLWGGLKPHTYRNYKTFAKDARGTLIHLQDRKNSGVVAISPVEQRKEDELRRFLVVCFAPSLATSKTVESLNQAGGSATAILITAAVKAKLPYGCLETMLSRSYTIKDIEHIFYFHSIKKCQIHRLGHELQKNVQKEKEKEREKGEFQEFWMYSGRKFRGSLEVFSLSPPLRKIEFPFPKSAMFKCLMETGSQSEPLVRT
ncbi:hypothetical protein R3P38DRAFT_2817284 [Favolaschia claudopus]|uniref:Uncharacterized protein n=1 Tax=Favolaschia claudopus TaxID=2862362 RepID=A0AAV9YY41_9AGAR